MGKWPFLLLLLVQLPVAAAAQTFGGTVVVVGMSRNEVVLAADSRNMIAGRPDDTACKVTALGGQLLFSAAGIAGAGAPSRPTWTAAEEAHLAYQTTLNTTQSPDPMLIATKWAATTSGLLKREVQEDPKTVSDGVKGLLLEGVFLGYHEDEIALVTSELSYNGPKSTTTVPVIDSETQEFKMRPSAGPFDFQFEAYGDGSGLAKARYAVTADAQDLQARWHALIDSKDRLALEKITVAIAQYSVASNTDGKLGGKIDVASLAKSGLRWISEKPECTAN